MQRRKTGCKRLRIISSERGSSASTVKFNSVLATIRKPWHLPRLCQLSIGRIWLKGTHRCLLNSAVWKHLWLPLSVTTASRQSNIWTSAKSSKMRKSWKLCRWRASLRVSWKRLDPRKVKIRLSRVFLGLKSLKIWSLLRMILSSIVSSKKKVILSFTKEKLCLPLQLIFPSVISRSAFKC